jgi:hypothetical protein
MILPYRQSTQGCAKSWQTVSCGDECYRQRNPATRINEAGIIADIAMNLS